MTGAGAAKPEDLAALERFVVENDDLLELEERIGRFNVFDVLRIARAEIRHSTALAFLLDPAESHGQGQLFLNALLMDLLKTSPASLRPCSPIELDGVDLRGVEIRREWRHLDLVIICAKPPFVVVIENKVDSGEHSNQLQSYEETVSQAFPDKKALRVLLSPTGIEPSLPSWIPYRYADLHRAFSRARKASATAIGDDVLVFVDHYLSVLGSQFMDDPTIDELCRRIYKNHRRALELIYDKVGSPSSGILATVEEVLSTDPRWHRFYTTAIFVDFVPASWLAWLPSGGLDYKEDGRSWFVVRFEAYGNRLDSYIEVRKQSDPGLRKKVIDALLPQIEKVGLKKKQSKGVSDSYTRVSGRDRLLEWPEDESPDADKVRTEVKKRLDSLYAKLEDLAPTLRAAIE